MNRSRFSYLAMCCVAGVLLSCAGSDSGEPFSPPLPGGSQQGASGSGSGSPTSGGGSQPSAGQAPGRAPSPAGPSTGRMDGKNLQFDQVMTLDKGGGQITRVGTKYYVVNGQIRRDDYDSVDGSMIQTTFLLPDRQVIINHKNRSYSDVRGRLDQIVSDMTAVVYQSDLRGKKSWKRVASETVEGHACERWEKQQNVDITGGKQGRQGGNLERAWFCADLGGLMLQYEATTFLGWNTHLQRGNVQAGAGTSALFRIPSGYKDVSANRR